MSVTITSFFSRNGEPLTGLSPTLRIWLVNATNNTLIVGSPDGIMSEIGDGFYKYIFTTIGGYNKDLDYIVRVDANDITLKAHERFQTANLAPTNITQSTVDDIVDAIWEEQATDHIDTGTTGLLLNQIKADTTQLVNSHIVEISLLELLLKYEKNKTKIDKSSYTLTIYDDDGITPLTIFDLKDDNGNPSIVAICERAPR